MVRIKKVLERDILRQIIEFLEYMGCLVIRLNNTGIPLKNGGFRPPRQRGLPDILAWIPRKKGLPVSVMIECKRPGAKTTKEQEMFLSDADLIGIKVLVASSVDFVKKELEQYLR